MMEFSNYNLSVHMHECKGTVSCDVSKGMGYRKSPQTGYCILLLRTTVCV